mmetsp:Transcript_28381/g.90447  ORF Transcript_28381/g.90447 Transcript_28381/m.90447 type:complete len:350 (+) Transcript_28381:218-1267(+)|eukprot:CAMPEP_0182858156 /NCGR_PEP_ID=MMETSP0034_2-20130328/3492_1 /TAXON_ID=156128 /ORGANISM="Nephroselmis pyriformis, Strain CCMP717" /LENGTH=349 /DNA_ID=CAMNT_0024989513 /DNA_START=263 /DNA_END=1312 /DNA_ORIENTATION=+
MGGRSIGLMATVLTVMTSSQSVLVALSQHNGGYAYNWAQIPFGSDLVKLLISVAAMYAAGGSEGVGFRNWKLYTFPAVMYALHNSLLFVTLEYVDPLTYQLMGSLKIVTTASFFWLILHRSLSKLQWISLALVVAGVTTSQLTACHAQHAAQLQTGYLMGLGSAICSALAGLYTEMALRTNDDPLHVQNVMMYGNGLAINAIRLTVDDIREGAGTYWPQRLGENFTGQTWVVLFSLALTGLLVSWIMKYAHTIIKVYSNSAALVMTTALSVILLGEHPTLPLVLGILTVGAGSAMYYMPPQELIGEDKAGELMRSMAHAPAPSLTRASTHPSVVAVSEAPRARESLMAQ